MTRRQETRRAGDVAAWLVVAGLILVLGFSPASRLAARGLPQPPPGSGPEVAGLHQEKATAVQDVPLGLPRGTRIRTAGDVLRYADAALGPSDARALMAVLKSSSLAQGFPVGYPSGHLEYPYRYPALALSALRSAITTFRRLAAAYPGDPGVLTGLGDAYLRAGTHLRFTESFTARKDLRLAMAAHSRACRRGCTLHSRRHGPWQP